MSLSREEMEEEGLDEEKKGTDLKPDEGFRHNPGEEPYRPDLTRYAPELRQQVEEAIYE